MFLSPLQCNIKEYAEYSLTGIIDALRNREYTRLERSGETYVDYTGGGMYPETLTKEHLDFLNTNVLGNTHSVNNRYSIYATNLAYFDN